MPAIIAGRRSGRQSDRHWKPTRAAHFSFAPGSTSPATVASVSFSLGPVASSIPCETSPLPKSRGARFATTTTRLPDERLGRERQREPGDDRARLGLADVDRQPEQLVLLRHPLARADDADAQIDGRELVVR